MMDMAATRCKDKVDNTENLSCIMIAKLLLLELIKTYFVKH
jgi:hypothetical protein